MYLLILVPDSEHYATRCCELRPTAEEQAVVTPFAMLDRPQRSFLAAALAAYAILRRADTEWNDGGLRDARLLSITSEGEIDRRWVWVDECFVEER